MKTMSDSSPAQAPACRCPTPESRPPPGLSRKRILVPFIVAVAFLMEQIDTTVITASLPAMAESFGAAPLSLNLAITSYVLSLAVFIPISGWVADRFGTQRVFLLAIAVFMVGSALCGCATTLPALVAARVFQGMGGALMTPVGRLILLRSFSRSELVMAMSYMTIPVLIGPLVGPLIGGAITTYLSWRWIFFVNIPIGLLGMFLVVRYIDGPSVENENPVSRPFDVGGFLLAGTALVCFQITVENLVHAFVPRPFTFGMLAAAVGFGALYVRFARRRVAPALDISLVAIRAFRVGSLVGGISRVGLNGVPFLLQLQLQVGFGYSPIHASLLVFLSAIGSMIMKPTTSLFLRLFGFRSLLIANSLVGSACVAAFALFRADTSLVVMLAAIFAYGVSRSLQLNVVQTLTFAEVPSDRQSAAVGVAGVVQQFSMSLGISVSAAIVSLIAGETIPEAADFSSAFLLMSLLPLIALPGFLPLRPGDGQETSHYRKYAPTKSD